jgi:uncharacterized protein (TIGR03437 family)
MACQRLALVVALLVLPPAALLAQENRITGPIERTRTVPLKGNVHPGAQAQYDRGPVEPSFELAYVTLLLKPSPSQQAALEQLLAQQQDPSSPNYHQWVTPEQYAARFGLSPGDIATIVSWLQSEGLKVNGVARGRHWIAFTGTAELIDSAFRTAIHRYDVEGETHFANASEPSLPAALAGVVSGFQGLDDFYPRPMHRFVPAGDPAYNSSSGAHYLAPDDFATIYDLNPLYTAGIDGTGQRIAIIGDTDVDLADIQNFRRRFNLPANDPQVVLYGPDPGMSSKSLGEADLDLEWSGAVARNATIVYVYSKNVNTASQYAIDQNLAPVLSLSFGGCELPVLSSSLAFRSVAQQASAQGITWLAASGDSGAAGCDAAFSSAQATKGLAVSFPASIPEVTAVGGTMFNESGGTGPYWATTNSPNLGSALSYIPETAWNESSTSCPPTGCLAASGGGASVLFSKPSWQTGPGVPNDNARDVPDVALTAALHDGYFGVTGGVNVVYTGTSAPTPSFAGIVALLNQYLVSTGAQAQPGSGNINPALYRLAQSTTNVFHDITTGNNIVPCAASSPNCKNGSMGYQAGPGYDLVTGLGSVDGYQLATQWNNPAGRTITTLTADSTAVTVNGAVKLTATVKAAAGSATPTGTVGFNSADNSIGSAPLTASGGTATATVSVSASQLPIGAGTVWAIYSGDASFSGSSASLVVTVGYPAGGSAVAASVSPNPIFASAYALGYYSWACSVALKETAGVATTLTGFTINGAPQTISNFFGSTSIPANGTLSSSTIHATGTSAPTTAIFGFSGTDAGGQTWSRQVSIVLYGSSMELFSAPTTVQQNPGAVPSCQWPQRLYVQEQSGLGVQLTRFLAGSNDLSSQIQQFFGTTQLAPFGLLEASVCWSGITPPQPETYEIDGTASNGSPVTAALSASLAAPAASTVVPSVSPAAVSMSATISSPTATSTVALSFTGGAPQWVAGLLVSGQTASWLQLSPVTGSGAAQLKLTASSAALVNGVYHATLVIQATNAIPQYIEVPVVLVVGASSATSVGAVTNAASFQSAVAPGALATIWGSGLAPAIQQAGSLPLPLAMQGVSVTVNGVFAPLLYVSPGQVNIQIPYETGAGTAVLGVENNGQAASYSFQVAASGPGIFNVFIDPTGAAVTSAARGGILTLFITGDGDASPPLATGAPPPANTSVASLPAPRLPVTVTVGGVAATPFLFIGIPTWSVGVTQINFTVPPDAPLGPQPVVVTVGGVASAPATLTVTQ